MQTNPRALINFNCWPSKSMTFKLYFLLTLSNVFRIGEAKLLASMTAGMGGGPSRWTWRALRSTSTHYTRSAWMQYTQNAAQWEKFSRTGGEWFLKKKNWTYVIMCQIVRGPQFQNFTLKCCFLTWCKAWQGRIKCWLLPQNKDDRMEKYCSLFVFHL